MWANNEPVLHKNLGRLVRLLFTLKQQDESRIPLQSNCHLKWCFASLFAVCNFLGGIDRWHLLCVVSKVPWKRQLSISFICFAVLLSALVLLNFFFCLVVVYLLFLGVGFYWGKLVSVRREEAGLPISILTGCHSRKNSLFTFLIHVMAHGNLFSLD